MRKHLGKISKVKFGHVGYQDVMLGLELSFSLDGGSLGIGMGGAPGMTWDPELMECTEYCKWTEEDRTQNLAEHMRWISKILKEAKVDNINDLTGIPVEVTIDKNTFKDFRILTEVL